jgi:hypothetical protein
MTRLEPPRPPHSTLEVGCGEQFLQVDVDQQQFQVQPRNLLLNLVLVAHGTSACSQEGAIRQAKLWFFRTRLSIRRSGHHIVRRNIRTIHSP